MNGGYEDILIPKYKKYVKKYEKNMKKTLKNNNNKN
jgi:hypothetical protein